MHTTAPPQRTATGTPPSPQAPAAAPAAPAVRTSRTLRWSVFGGMGASLLGGLLLAFGPMVLADRALQSFCRAQVPGTALATVQAAAQPAGYSAEPVAPDRLLVDDPAGFGRRQCLLALDAQGRVTDAAPSR